MTKCFFLVKGVEHKSRTCQQNVPDFGQSHKMKGEQVFKVALGRSTAHFVRGFGNELWRAQEAEKTK